MQQKPKYIILREKDMTPWEYEKLAERVLAITEKYHVMLILHTFIEVARKLKHKKIHLSMTQLRKLHHKDFDIVGASTHTVEEAIEAEHLGADYITASHIFRTDCKKGVPPRGLDYLQKVMYAVNIPVYGLGGITPDTMESVMKTGAAGCCMMSFFIS